MIASEMLAILARSGTPKGMVTRWVQAPAPRTLRLRLIRSKF